MRYLAVYERKRNARPRCLLVKCKKCDISPFRTKSTRNNLNQTGRRDSDRTKHNLTRLFSLPLKNGHEWSCCTLRTSADFFSTILTSATRSRYPSLLMLSDRHFCMHVHPPIMPAALSFHTHLHLVLRTADWRKRNCPFTQTPNHARYNERCSRACSKTVLYSWGSGFSSWLENYIVLILILCRYILRSLFQIRYLSFLPFSSAKPSWLIGLSNQLYIIWTWAFFFFFAFCWPCILI